MVPVDPLLQDVADRLRPLTFGLSVETVLVVPIIGSQAGHPVIARIGSPSKVRVEPADVLRPAMLVGAPEAVLAHNHLADTGISAEDLAVTRRLVAAATVVGVRLRAHLVLSPRGWADVLDRQHISHRYAAR